MFSVKCEKMTCKFELLYSVGHTDISVCDQDGGKKDLEIKISDDGERKTVTVKALKTLTLKRYREFEHSFLKVHSDNLYFINGYQSWTDTKEFYLNEKEHDVKKLPKALVEKFSFDSYGDASFYEYNNKKLHGYDFFYTKGKDNSFVVSLNNDNAYLIFELDKKAKKVTLISDISGVVLKAGEEYTVCDYFYTQNADNVTDKLKKYIKPRNAEKIFGYTSWYNYYQDINEDIINRDLDALDKRFNLFQIDDGYETFVGDWLDVDRKKFPNGLESIVEKIHTKGYMAGIWLAPFVAEEKSKLFREKPQWFKRDKDGNFVKCGANWSGFYALDTDNKFVKEYIKKCLKHYSDMGFDFFKLDFLYAANLPEYKGKTRSRAASDAYSFLREVLGEKLILGCGATVGNAIGKFDYLRVGPDVSLKFDDIWYMKFMHRERISTKVTLQNTVYRSFTDGVFFGNDPDVFLLRDGNIKLSKNQRQALITINALFGSVMMTSDNIAEYDDEKNQILSRALTLFKDGKVNCFSRKGRIITVSYSLDGKTSAFKYDTKRGLIYD